MKESNILREAREKVQELMKNNDPSHDWFHVERVYRNAMYLYDLESQRLFNRGVNLDLLVIQIAALFHDIADFKYEYNNIMDPKEILEERLGDFFKRFESECTKEQKNEIFHIILNISWRKELEMKDTVDISHELKIVRDADRLDAIGAIGIARCMAFSGIKKRPFYDDNIKPIFEMTAEEYNKQTIKNQSTAVNHFYEKLLLIKDKMQTETGKKMALQRHEFMEAYLKQFDFERKYE